MLARTLAFTAAVLELEPNRYRFVCFISFGGGDQGPPHFTEGMLAEATVS